MRSSKPVASPDINILREKIRLKKVDRQVYVNQAESVFNGNREKGRRLRIGNVCLRNMTKKQTDLPVTLNAAIFHSHPLSERVQMKSVPLQDSILINDTRLFKLGKRLLKQDYIRGQKETRLTGVRENLANTKREATMDQKQYEQECEEFLHKQVMVDDSNNRELAARLTHQRLQKILDELKEDIRTFPLRIKEKEKKIMEQTKELQDFLALRNRAQRYLEIEGEHLKPLDQELAQVTEHFEQMIAVTKNGIEDRRKKGTLAKFLAEREANQLAFVETSSLDEVKQRNRNKSMVQAYDVMNALIDAMMVSDVKNVVDCFLDQSEVTEMLNAEKKSKEVLNANLKNQLEDLQTNNEFFKYDALKNSKFQIKYQKVGADEAYEIKMYEHTDSLLRKQDKLVSALQLVVDSLLEKLRPIKLEDSMNRSHGNLLHDIVSVVKKAEKMTNIIEKNAIPIGRVRPIMLHMFKDKRLPSDCVRVEASQNGPGCSMSAYETFEADQPGFVSREMLKMRAHEIAANKKNKGQKDKRG